MISLINLQEKSFLVLLHGKAGVGKTHMLVCVLLYKWREKETESKKGQYLYNENFISLRLILI